MAAWWITIALLAVSAAASAEADPAPAPTVTPDVSPLQQLYERVYHSSGRRAATGDSGEPLLLTSLIEEGKVEEAREAARVDSDQLLPDMDSYAGYLTVDKRYNSNLWFWYFPATEQPAESAPWVLWLQGGPGASSLYGLFTEIGPFQVTEDYTLQEMEYSWGRNHSLLFIDNPVGTGFSFTDDDRGYATNQTTIGEQLYCALQQFLRLFPELRQAPLVVAGESYAGKHIPSLAIQIHRHKDSADPPIRLEGLAIGNGFIDPLTMQHYSDFARQVGLVDDNVAKAMKKLERAVVQFIKTGDTINAYMSYNYLLNVLLHESHLGNIYNYMEDDIDIDGPYTEFIQRSEVRRALHVGNRNFTNIGRVYNKLVPDFMNSAKTWLEELLEHYRVLCYSGHQDIIVAYPLSVSTYRSLQYSGAVEYRVAKRHPWYHNKRLVGYYKTAGNLTEVMLRRAGHMVPADVPAPALGLVSAFARGLSLEQDTGPLAEPPARALNTRRLTLPVD